MRNLSIIFAIIAGAHLVSAEILIDDFTSNPEGKEKIEISAPNPKHYVTNQRQRGLDPDKTIGGSRLGSLNAGKLKAAQITASFDSRKGIWAVVFPKGEGGFAFVSYNGGSGERRQPGADLAKGGNDRITIEVKSAPTNGKLSVVLYAGREFGKQSLPVEGAGSYEFLFKGFAGEGNRNGIDPARLDGVGIELHVKESKGEVYEISRIVARKGPVGKR